MEYAIGAVLGIAGWVMGQQIAGFITRWWEDTFKGIGA